MRDEQRRLQRPGGTRADAADASRARPASKPGRTSRTRAGTADRRTIGASHSRGFFGPCLSGVPCPPAVSTRTDIRLHQTLKRRFANRQRLHASQRNRCRDAREQSVLRAQVLSDARESELVETDRGPDHGERREPARSRPTMPTSRTAIRPATATALPRQSAGSCRARGQARTRRWPRDPTRR